MPSIHAKATPKAETMKDAAASQNIGADVDTAEKNFRQLQKNMKHLLQQLKDQHEAMLLLNEKRIQTATSLDAFVADTPLNKVAGVVNLDEVKASLFKVKLVEPTIDQYQPAQAQAQQHVNPPVVKKKVSIPPPPITTSKSVDTHETEVISPSHSSSSSAASSSDNDNNNEKEGSSHDGISESDEEVEQEETAATEEHVVQQMQEESTTVSSMLANNNRPVSRQSSTGTNSSHSGHCATTLTTTNVAPPNNNISNKTAAMIPMSEIECDTSIKVAPPEFFDIENSFAAIVQTSYKLNKMYADQYDEQLVSYVDKWITTVSSRIDSLLGEFQDHIEKLEHYRSKIEKMNAEVELAESKGKSLGKRKLDKWERNKLKLNGAREAHDSYGESLYLLMEEVTERAWRDIFPVLLRTLEFQMNHSQDDAKVCTKLSTSIQELYRIGYEEGISPSGRLEQLKSQKPEALYTGLRDHVVPPVTKSPSTTPPQSQQVYSSSATAVSF